MALARLIATLWAGFALLAPPWRVEPGTAPYAWHSDTGPGIIISNLGGWPLYITNPFSILLLSYGDLAKHRAERLLIVVSALLSVGLGIMQYKIRFESITDHSYYLDNVMLIDVAFLW